MRNIASLFLVVEVDPQLLDPLLQSCNSNLLNTYL